MAKKVEAKKVETKKTVTQKTVTATQETSVKDATEGVENAELIEESSSLWLDVGVMGDDEEEEDRSETLF